MSRPTLLVLSLFVGFLGGGFRGGSMPDDRLRAENWPAWRGPEGSGACREQGFPLEWSAEKTE